MTFATTSGDITYWDSLLGARPSGGYPTHFVNTYGAAFSSPAGVPKGYWCQRISAAGKTAHQLLAETVDALGPPAEFGIENGKPGMVMWDELNGSTGNTIAGAANLMLTTYGATYLYRWGTYLVNGPDVSYSNLAFPLDHVMAGGGRIAVELYPYYVASPSHPGGDRFYWGGGTTTAGRDEWMRQFFMGRDTSPSNPVPPAQRVTVDRLEWLMARKASLWPGSATIIHPIFGVTTRFVNGSQPNRFMDRMFYVFQKSSQGWLMSSSNDLGVGSWTWASSGSSDWDGWFRVMWDYYCESYSSTKAPRTSAPSSA